MQTLRVIEGAALPEALTFVVLPESRRANSGQVWQVMKIRGRTLHCMVMPGDHDYMNEPRDMLVCHWQWATRKRRP